MIDGYGDIIDGVFAMINQRNDTHYFAVCTEALIHSVRAKQRLCSTITNKLPQLKYIHFALNVKRMNDGKVLVGNGSHWTYFVLALLLMNSITEIVLVGSCLQIFLQL